MKSLIALVLTAFLFVTTAPQALAAGHAHGDHAAQNYHCPMHPEVVGEKGDTCPKCGMNLEQMKAAKDGHNCDNCPKHKQAVYDCPMHPEVTGVKGDTCPKCGMNLEPVKAAKDGESCQNCPKHNKKAAAYDCPMHPEVVGEKGDTCPKCGMNLEAVKGKKASGHHAHHKGH